MNQKPKVAFICVHNSCRSQIAEALGKYLAADVFESYSAGTETVPRINPDAVRIMKQLYDIDMELTQRSKLLSELPPVDIVVTMGCNVNCPHLPCKHREDWGLTILRDAKTRSSKKPFKPFIKRSFHSNTGLKTVFSAIEVLDIGIVINTPKSTILEKRVETRN